MKLKKVILLLSVVLVTCLLAVALYAHPSTPFLEAPSVHTGPALAGAAAWTEQQQYPGDMERLTVYASNEGNTWTESEHPVLEMQHDGIWYTLKDFDKDGIYPLNALSVLPWETEEFEFYVGRYGSRLRPGHYRVVFAMLYDGSYVAAEFDIV